MYGVALPIIIIIAIGDINNSKIVMKNISTFHKNAFIKDKLQAIQLCTPLLEPDSIQSSLYLILY